MPLLEAIERRATRLEVPVDSRIERGRTPRHALAQLTEHERFDRIVVPAQTSRSDGFPPGRHRLAARACSWRSRRATTGRRREAPLENGSGRPLDPRAQDTRCRGLESARAQEMFH